ncbi:cyclin-dependent kinase inhibitor 3 family protein [Vibrio caribbeanicus]|uniref:Protein tyrosine phosphatase n=1 Tax=Vibrio caribbeanicus ATCC BAA-2122 TaxID=796620 RepID=E3BQ14_9VIBR|nr:cyclin-dependent kinase inhibitor 3 family protein [Vibrio caribbeanicus]EFP94819.1 protein tyrosine phosphatase [Vibrio caribbeanicus ATCC BAA-2122]
MVHPTWELPIDDNKAALVLTPCPGTKEVSLDDSIEQLKSQGITIIITALSSKEMQEKGVGDLPNVIEKAGLRWVHAPIEDDVAPDKDFQTRWTQCSPMLHQALADGEKIAMHCMGGSGRTGLLAAHLLLEKGWELREIITHVQALRPGAFTKSVQVEYIHKFADH